ncbi:uncharacterized protein B0H64DRAFT_383315 [Chaetomium fimeti]|uniref:Uncharacterized protein n=1 Tax=Chaetomium fimeti TaxID=1854472 RepID=A0AAE0HRG5_9PEZI|nr:hypothetical protein B0H64DRAFT_383315 [Chaetomium fimeti]
MAKKGPKPNGASVCRRFAINHSIGRRLVCKRTNSGTSRYRRLRGVFGGNENPPVSAFRTLARVGGVLCLVSISILISPCQRITSRLIIALLRASKLLLNICKPLKSLKPLRNCPRILLRVISLDREYLRFARDSRHLDLGLVHPLTRSLVLWA